MMSTYPGIRPPVRQLYSIIFILLVLSIDSLVLPIATQEELSQAVSPVGVVSNGGDTITNGPLVAPFPSFPPFPPPPSIMLPPPPLFGKGVPNSSAVNGCGWAMGFTYPGSKGISCTYQNGYITENGVTRQATPEEIARMELAGQQMNAQMKNFFQHLLCNNVLPFGGRSGPMIGGGELAPFGPSPLGIGGSVIGAGIETLPEGQEETGPPLDLSTALPLMASSR